MQMSKIVTDAEAFIKMVPSILAGNGLSADTPLVLYGRSIGGYCAVHLAEKVTLTRVVSRWFGTI